MKSNSNVFKKPSFTIKAKRMATVQKAKARAVDLEKPGQLVEEAMGGARARIDFTRLVRPELKSRDAAGPRLR